MNSLEANDLPESVSPLWQKTQQEGESALCLFTEVLRLLLT